MQQPITRDDLEPRIDSVLNRGGWGNPDVLLVRDGDSFVVVKDYAPRPAWVQRLIAPFIIGREVKALQALAGHPFVPPVLQHIDKLAFAMEYRPGDWMDVEIADQVPRSFLTELAEGVDQMHAMGVVHLDLRNRGNVLAGKDGHPVLLDFASALRFKPGSLASRLIQPLLARADLSAVVKWRGILKVTSSPKVAGPPPEDG